MIPLALVMVLLLLLMVPAEGAWHLLALPSSVQVREAALLFAQVSSHAATLHRPLLTSTLCLRVLFSGLLNKHKTLLLLLPDGRVARSGKTKDE